MMSAAAESGGDEPRRLDSLAAVANRAVLRQQAHLRGVSPMSQFPIAAHCSFPPSVTMITKALTRRPRSISFFHFSARPRCGAERRRLSKTTR
jgi:hypothetical protein